MTITITQQQLDETPPQHHFWRWPGVTGPGQYTWDEAANTHRPAAESPSPAGPGDSEHHGVMGIGGIGVYAENEKPTIPSAKTLERYERRLATAVVCRRCRASSLDGAMFTTDAGGNVCDDCF